MADLWIFVGALAVAYLMPGPDMVLLLQTGASWGRMHVLLTAAGLGAARIAHVALAAVGLAALMKTSPLAFEIVRFGGAAYLVWLGISILRAPSLLPPAEAAATGGRATAQSHLAALRRGFLTNMLNPKALLFCSVLLPQFVRPGEAVVPQFILLGIILVSAGVFFDIVYGMAGTALGAWLRRHRPMQAVQRWAFGCLLIGFGARLALSARP